MDKKESIIGIFGQVFSDPTSIILYAISILGAQIGIVLLLVGKTTSKKRKRLGLIITLLSLAIFIVSYVVSVVIH